MGTEHYVTICADDPSEELWGYLKSLESMITDLERDHQPEVAKIIKSHRDKIFEIQDKLAIHHKRMKPILKAVIKSDTNAWPQGKLMDVLRASPAFAEALDELEAKE